jgi:hypothetical protein
LIGVVPVQVPVEAVSVWPCCGVPLMAGSAVFAGATPVTAEVWLLVAEALPAGLVAVTTTRIVEAGEVTSAFCTTYVELVAPEMSTQLAPDALQRRHW